MAAPIQPDRTGRILAFASAALLLSLALLSVMLTGPVPAEGTPVPRAARPVFEDGFYYLQLARQAAAGNGPALDGITATNGFHPLWLLLLVPAGRAPSAAGMLTLALLLQVILLGATLFLLRDLLRRWGAGGWSWFGVLAWLLAAGPLSISGLEFGLQAFLLVGLARLWAIDVGPRRWFYLGLWAALAGLARLDNFLLALLLSLAIVTKGARPRYREALSFTTPIILAAGGYVVWTTSQFGLPLPISGMLKREWSSQMMALEAPATPAGWVVSKAGNALWPLWQLPALWPGLLLIGLLSAILLIGRRSRWWPWALFTGCQFAFYTLVYHGALTSTPWYYVVGPGLGLSLLVVGLAAISRALPANPFQPGQRFAAFALASGREWPGLVALAAAYALLMTSRPAPDQPLIIAAIWADTNLPETAVVGSWNAGAISFLSGRRTVNLDGLVNGPGFLTDRHDLCAYWDTTGVTHLVDIVDDRWGRDQPIAPVPVRGAYARCSNRLSEIWRRSFPDVAWYVGAYALAAQKSR